MAFSYCIYKWKQFWFYSFGSFAAVFMAFSEFVSSWNSLRNFSLFLDPILSSSVSSGKMQCWSLRGTPGAGSNETGCPRCFKVELWGVNRAYEYICLDICWTGVFSVMYVCTLNCFTGCCLSCDRFLGSFTPQRVSMNSSEHETICAQP